MRINVGSSCPCYRSSKFTQSLVVILFVCIINLLGKCEAAVRASNVTVSPSAAQQVTKKQVFKKQVVKQPSQPDFATLQPALIVSELPDQPPPEEPEKKRSVVPAKPYRWVDSTRTIPFPGFSKQFIELFSPQFYETEYKVTSKKPWILSHMTKAAKGLIVKHLTPIVTANLNPPGEGWERIISIEEDRPDGFPAITFVHLSDAEITVKAYYDQVQRTTFLQFVDKMPISNVQEASAMISRAIEPYLKSELEKTGNQQQSAYEFKMQLRHDLYCAQVTSTFKSTLGAKQAPYQKQTFIGRMYFARLKPSDAPTKKPTGLGFYEPDYYSYSGPGRWDLIQYGDGNTDEDHRGAYGFLEKHETETNAHPPMTEIQGGTEKSIEGRFPSQSVSEQGRRSRLVRTHSSTQQQNSSPYHSFLQAVDASAQTPIIALSAAGLPPIRMQGEGVDPEDRKYLETAITEFNLLSLRPNFPCVEGGVLNRPGMQDACIFTRDVGPKKLPVDYTAEQMLIQCMARYPLQSWIIFKKLTPIAEKRVGETVVQPASVKEEWILQLCTPKGWSKSVPMDEGAKLYQQCVQSRGDVSPAPTVWSNL